MRAASGDTAVAYDPETARIAVASGGGTLLSGTVGVRLGDGTVCRPVADDSAHSAVAATLHIDAADGAIDLTLSVENRSDEPVALAGFDLVSGTAAFGPTDRVFEHGYQSWTPTATLRLDERFPAESERSRPQMTDLAAPDDARTSHAVTALSGDAGTLTLGFLDHGAYLSRFDLRTDTDETALAATCPADGVELAPGERRASATLRVDATRSIPGALAGIADAVAARMGARVPSDVPTGWCSWYHYFTDVTADDVRANLRDVADWGVPLDIVQLDDGYETAFGDWRTLADGFEDMRGLRDDIADAGRTPGLWLAPFYVQADSRLARDRPEWLVTRDGEPVDAGARHGPMYALDTTHPGVEAWLAETFETVVGDWGFDYLKLDFLYAAALPGDRHADATRAAAYRRGLETIRDAVGETFVLGCGAPGFPSVGLVDAMRVGPDTAPYWRRDGESASQPAHENAVRNVLSRQFCHRRLWANDPDCQLVRTTTDLSRAERESFAALVALTGGANFVSDAVAEIDAESRRLFERTLPTVADGRVEGVGRREFPERVVCERAADGAVAVAAFNWTDDARTLQIDPAEYVEGAAAVAFDALGDASEGSAPDGGAPGDRPAVVRGPVEREVPPHGVLLVHCAPAADRPRLVGSRHLANAASQVADVAWGDGTLSVTLDAAEPMAFVVAAPEPWRLAGDGRETSDGGAVTVTAEPGDNHFQFTDT